MFKTSEFHTLSRRLILRINEKDFFHIGLKNFLFVILSLGIYLPWALREVHNYLFSKIYFMGKRFIHLTSKKNIFRFNLGITLCILLLILNLWFIALPLIPIMLYWGLNIYVGNNIYRLKKFSISVSLKEFYKVFFFYFLLVILTCGLLLPWFCRKANELIFNNVSYGNYRGKLNLSLLHLYGIFFRLLLLTVSFFCLIFFFCYSIKSFFPNLEKLVYLALLYPYIFTSIPLFFFCFLVRQWQYTWDSFNIGDVIFFERNISFGKCLYFWFSLIFCSIISLGLLYPARLYELLKYLISTHKIYLKGNVGVILNRKA